MKQSSASEELLADVVKAQGSDGFAAALAAWLKAVFHYDNITVIAYFSASPPDLLIANAEQDSVHANFDRIYSAGAYLLDPFYDLHTSAAPPDIYRLSDIAPDQFRRHRYFLDYYQATTMVDEFAFVAYPAPGKSVHVCLGRDSTSNAKFTARELKLAKRMLPVVLAFVEKEWAKSDKPGTHSSANITERLIGALKDETGISLSPRQAEVALLILRGNSSVSIGLRLGVSAQTVKVFRKQLYRKCEISSQAELFNMLLPLLNTLSIEYQP